MDLQMSAIPAVADVVPQRSGLTVKDGMRSFFPERGTGDVRKKNPHRNTAISVKFYCLPTRTPPNWSKGLRIA